MKTIEAIVKESKLVYPEKNKDGTLKGIPSYKTTVAFKENEVPLECSFFDEFAYFDVGSKIEVGYNGKRVKIKEAQHNIPHQVNTLVRLGRKHPYIAVIIFIIVLSWIIIFGLMGSLLAALPVGIFFTCGGILNVINYFKMKKVVVIKSTIKDIIRKYESSSTNIKKWNYYYVYEYVYNKQTLLHNSFFPGAKKDKIGSKVNLIYNKTNNIIIEKNKRKSLLFNGLLSIIGGIIFCILVFILK